MKPEILKLGKTPVELGTPLNAISIDLTERCNLRCDYCFCDLSAEDITKKNLKTTDLNKDLTLDMGKEITDWFFSDGVSGKASKLQIDFWGGEPLLKFDLIKELTKYIRTKEKEFNKKITLGLTTNIISLNEEKIKWLRDNHVGFLLSCDGIGESNAARKTVNGENSWGIIKEKLDLIKDMYAEDKTNFPSIRITVNKYNIHKFGEDLISFFKMGFKGSFFSENFDEKWNEEDLENYKKQLQLIVAFRLNQAKEFKDFFATKFLDDALKYHRSLVNDSTRTCGSGHGFFSVSTEGALYPCHRLNKHNTQDKNWHDKYLNLGSIWENVTNEELYKDIANLQPTYINENSKYFGTACEACQYFPICNGGCFAVKYDNTQKINGIVDSICKTKEILWNVSLDEWSKVSKDPEIREIYSSVLFKKIGTCTCDSTQHINEISNIKEMLIHDRLNIENKDDIEMLNMLYLLHNHVEISILKLFEKYYEEKSNCVCFQGNYNYSPDNAEISSEKLEELLNIYNIYNNIQQGNKNA